MQAVPDGLPANVHVSGRLRMLLEETNLVCEACLWMKRF